MVLVTWGWLVSLIVFVIKRFQIDLELIVQINRRYGASLERIRLLADQGEILQLEIDFEWFETVSEW